MVNVPARTYSLQYDDTGARDLATIQVNFKGSQVNTFSGPKVMVNGDAYYTLTMSMVGYQTAIKLQPVIYRASAFK